MKLQLAVDLIVLYSVLCFTAVSLLGWGNLSFKLIGIKVNKKIDTVSIWFGFCIVLGLIDLVNIFTPINWKISITFLLIGISYILYDLCINWVNIYRCKLINNKNEYFYIVLASVLIVLWSLRAMGIPNNYDSGLYHFQTIRWINEQPLAIGLANLHWRLALNQSYFNFLALLNFSPYWGKGYATGGLFLLLLTAASLIEVSSKQNKNWQIVFVGILIIYFGYIASTVANPSPDSAVGLMQAVVFILIFQIFCEKSELKKINSDYSKKISTILILCLTLITIKLSSLAYSVAILIIIGWMNKDILIHKYRNWFGIFFLLVSIGCIHIVRGYLLSGYPLLPSSVGGDSYLSWAMPSEIVKYEANLISEWARTHGENITSENKSNFKWIFIWFKRLSLQSTALIIINLGSLVFTILLLINYQNWKKIGNLLLLYFPLIIAIIFWFVMAPDLRFLGSILILIISFNLWIWLEIFQEKKFLIKIFTNKIFTTICFICIALISIKLVGLNSISLSGWKNIPKISVESKVTNFGLSVWVPTKGDQCWDTELPCVSIFNDYLDKTKHFYFIHMPNK